MNIASFLFANILPYLIKAAVLFQIIRCLSKNDVSEMDSLTELFGVCFRQDNCGHFFYSCWLIFQ